MSLLQSFLLGILQGIAEFLPISSSGHLAIAKDFMEIPDVPALYDVILHFATLLVIIIFFRDIIWRLLKVFFRFISGKKQASDKDDLNMIFAVLIGTLLTVVFGVIYEKFDIEKKLGIEFVYGLFIFTGLILLSTLFVKKNREKRNYIRLSDGFITGLAQCVAILPGVSRSGSTISASLLSGIDRAKAGEFSFVLSVPAICGALILKLITEGSSLADSVSFNAILIGFVASFFSGFVALALLMKLIKSGRFYLFSIYLIPLGILGLAGVFEIIFK
ncbi:MAG: undecaprenyl-diphosphate phosphatase [Spirochaetales bacterium]|nr:undecaprenyl-diphosphate phosphatase [Spirochaetales bacterium]